MKTWFESLAAKALCRLAADDAEKLKKLPTVQKMVREAELRIIEEKKEAQQLISGLTDDLRKMQESDQYFKVHITDMTDGTPYAVEFIPVPPLMDGLPDRSLWLEGIVDTPTRRTMKEWVFELLSSFPQLRCNRKLLVVYYWLLVDGVNFQDMNQLISDIRDKASDAESICRCTRLIQKEFPNIAQEKRIHSSE